MEFDRVARAAKRGATLLAPLPRADKDAALHRIADALISRSPDIEKANAEDVDRARAEGTAQQGHVMIDRLRLDGGRIEQIADAVRHVAGLPDPVGEVIRGSTLPNGLELRQIRVPLGVIGIIYEGRPNVTVDAAVLCLKSGNAALLRGSSSAISSNTMLVEVMQEALGGLAEAVQLVPGTGRESAQALMRARGLVDVLIPRGGAGLINTVVEQSTVPVIETGVGNCHVYVDAEADLDMALDILINAKTQRPSVCNAAETVLVHTAVADAFLPRALRALEDKGVTVHGDERVIAYGGVPATEDDWRTEYLALDIAAAVVDSLDAAAAHIAEYGSAHTEAIITRSLPNARRFTSLVDAAAVAVNASTRFTDGGEFGFGAEIGISTQKLHARGPMGLPELTTTKYVFTGDGHVR